MWRFFSLLAGVPLVGWGATALTIHLIDGSVYLTPEDKIRVHGEIGAQAEQLSEKLGRAADALEALMSVPKGSPGQIPVPPIPQEKRERLIKETEEMFKEINENLKKDLERSLDHRAVAWKINRSYSAVLGVLFTVGMFFWLTLLNLLEVYLVRALGSGMIVRSLVEFPGETFGINLERLPPEKRPAVLRKLGSFRGLLRELLRLRNTLSLLPMKSSGRLSRLLDAFRGMENFFAASGVPIIEPHFARLHELKEKEEMISLRVEERVRKELERYEDQRQFAESAVQAAQSKKEELDAQQRNLERVRTELESQQADLWQLFSDAETAEKGLLRRSSELEARLLRIDAGAAYLAEHVDTLHAYCPEAPVILNELARILEIAHGPPKIDAGCFSYTL